MRLLSTTIFNSTLNRAIKKADLDRSISQSLTQILGYPDDLALITRTLEETFLKLIREGKE